MQPSSACLVSGIWQQSMPICSGMQQLLAPLRLTLAVSGCRHRHRHRHQRAGGRRNSYVSKSADATDNGYVPIRREENMWRDPIVVDWNVPSFSIRYRPDFSQVDSIALRGQFTRSPDQRTRNSLHLEESLRLCENRCRKSILTAPRTKNARLTRVLSLMHRNSNKLRKQ